MWPVIDNKSGIIDNYKEFPKTNNALWFLFEPFKREINDGTNFIKADWNDPTITKNYPFEILAIIPLFCQFPSISFYKKIIQSKPFKSMLKWIISFNKIEKCVEQLVNKYPELNKDQIMQITLDYVYLKSYFELTEIIALYNNELSNDIKKYFINIKRRIKETEKTKQKSVSQLENFISAFTSELRHSQEQDKLKEFIFTFDSIFQDRKITSKSITDNFSLLLMIMFQEKYGEEIGSRKLISFFSGGKHREILRQIPLTQLKEIKQRRLHRDLFEYLMVIAKDEKLLSEKEYNQSVDNSFNKREFPYNSYKDYMESKAKIIFGLT